MSGGSFGEMGNLLAAAQKMRKAMDEAKEEIAGLEVQGTAGGELVVVDATGDGEIRRIAIGDEAWSSGKEAVEELVQAAVSDALAKATRLRDERLSKVTGGLNLPGLL